jgi:hypothetical protein
MQLAHHPVGRLASHVEKMWYCDGYQGVHRKERVLPNGKFQLVISLAKGPLRAPARPTGELGEIASSLVLGIRSHFGVIDTATLKSAMGVLFRPGGARAFFARGRPQRDAEGVKFESGESFCYNGVGNRCNCSFWVSVLNSTKSSPVLSGDRRGNKSSRWLRQFCSDSAKALFVLG